MTRKPLTQEQLDRLCKCAPIVMEMLNLSEIAFLERSYTYEALITSKLRNYIEKGGQVPKEFVPCSSRTGG